MSDKNKEIKNSILNTIINEKKAKESVVAVSNDSIAQFQLTVDGNNALTLNLDTTTEQQNTLLSDDQVSTLPTSFDAIVEIRSSKGVLLLPRLTSSQLATLTATPGMLAHNLDEGFMTHVGTDLTFNIVPTISPGTHISNSIIIFGDGTGAKFADTNVMINSTTNDMTFPTGASVVFTSNGFLYNLSAPTSITDNFNFTLPNNIPDVGQVLTSIDDQGNTTWTTVPGIGPILTGLTLVETETLTATSAVTAGDFLTSGGLVADGTVSAGTLVSTGDITAESDITSMRLNLLANSHILTIEGNIAQVSDITLIFPSNKGSVNQVLATDGNGNLDWVTHNVFIDTGVAATVGFDTLNGTNGVTINTTAVTTNSIINITRNMGAGMPPVVTTIGNLIVGSIIDNTSFIVYSTTANDSGDFNWLIINP